MPRANYHNFYLSQLSKKIPYDGSGTDVYEQLDNVARALDAAEIQTCTYKDSAGQAVTVHWDSDTKGIDDYLMNSR